MGDRRSEEGSGSGSYADERVTFWEWLMVSDPWPISEEAQEQMVLLANGRA